jgi:phospholipase C
MAVLLGVALGLLLGSGPVYAGSLKDIEHVVIFMQENRSWNSVGLVDSVVNLFY